MFTAAHRIDITKANQPQDGCHGAGDFLAQQLFVIFPGNFRCW